MRHLNLLIIILITTMSLQAQNYVNVRFTSQMQGGTYHVLDSVKVMNLTRGWEEMLYYPDTVLQMTNSTGIAETQTQGNALMQNIPNPFKASTEVSIRLQAPENISLVLYDMSGKQCAAYSAFLAAGKHGFTLRVGAAQAYILSLQSSEGTQSITVLASERGSAFQISYTNYITQADEKPIQKAHTDNEFQTGDNMKFIGYTTYDSTKRTHQLRVSQGGADADYTFQFAIGYAVGDVYYDESGAAEGIVCWIADTVFSDSGKYYGLYGKMISMDESDEGLMFAIINRSTNSYDSVDGRVNTALQMALRSDTSTYLYKDRIEAVKWCTDKGEGWYFPAKCEMTQLFENFTIINHALQQNQGTLIGTYFDIKVYWASTETADGKNAYILYYKNNIVYVSYAIFYQTLYVRAMKWFNEQEK
ncbi:MAG: T9SS type A sorting domain-containing protein [Bacteroidales bacterium]|nr:T9SS type A sorting domain-containing protein [Bacteroidales bacterium]